MRRVLLPILEYVSQAVRSQIYPFVGHLQRLGSQGRHIDGDSPEYHPYIFSDASVPGHFNGVLALLESHVAPDGKLRHLFKEWRMEILNGLPILNLAILARWLEDTPHLRAKLQSTRVPGGQVIPKAADLRLLCTVPNWDGVSTKPFALQHLTTLLLVAVPWMASFTTWHLPSLRHLSITTFGSRKHLNHCLDPIDPDASAEKMLEIVRHLGKNLTTLHYQGPIEACPMPSTWPNIPHVERIQMPYWRGIIITADHRVRIVTIPIVPLSMFIQPKEITPQSSVVEYLPYPTQIPARNLIIKMNIPWFIALTRTSSKIATWLRQYYEGSGAKFTDSDGITFQRYLVFLIQYFWEDLRGQSNPKHRRYNEIFSF